jgi:hypothetical protein
MRTHRRHPAVEFLKGNTMRYLHNVPSFVETTQGLFSVIIPNKAVGFYSDDGFGNYVTFDNTIIQVMASAESLIQQTCAERDEAPLPNLIE